MWRMIFSVAVVLVISQAAYANSIEVISLIERQGENDTSLLIGADDASLAQYVPDGKLHSQILAFLVKFGGNTILFDTGLRAGNIPSELAKHDVKPEDITTILITHLHPDHFGGLVNTSGKAQYPNANIYVSKPERAYWVDEVRNEAVIEALKLYDGRVNLFDFGDEVVQGVKAIDTTGHTPGHTSYLVESEGDKLLVVGDVLHFIEIQLPKPEVAVRYDVDPDGARVSRKFILDYAAMKGIRIAGMHVTPPGVLSIKKSGAGYEKVSVE